MESAQASDQTAVLDKLEELVALGASTTAAAAEPHVALPPREAPPKPAAAPVRKADDADVIDLPKPRPTVASPAAARQAEPVAVTPAARPLPPSQPNPAEGVLRTVRATTTTAVAPKKGPAVATGVTPHAPDDPGLDGEDIIEPKRPYLAPYTVPAKQRT